MNLSEYEKNLHGWLEEIESLMEEFGYEDKIGLHKITCIDKEGNLEKLEAFFSNLEVDEIDNLLSLVKKFNFLLQEENHGFLEKIIRVDYIVGANIEAGASTIGYVFGPIIYDSSEGVKETMSIERCGENKEIAEEFNHAYKSLEKILSGCEEKEVRQEYEINKKIFQQAYFGSEN